MRRPASSRPAGGRAPSRAPAAAGSTCLLSLRLRSVSAMAATIATSRITAAISSGYRYSVYSSLPSSLVLEYCAPPWPRRARLAALRPGGSPPISTAAISSAISAPTLAASGKCFQKPGAQGVDVDVQHHHHEQEQHHHRADVDQHQRDRQELGPQQHPDRRGLEEGEHQVQRRIDRVARGDHAEGREQQHRGKQVEESRF